MKPPIIWRLVNALRAYCERDERLLVEQWKDVLKPEPRKVQKDAPINLLVYRDARIRRIA